MCQHNSRFIKRDAERRHAYKLVRRHNDTTWHSRYQWSVFAKGLETVAHDCNREFHEARFRQTGSLHGGVFHVYPDLKTARREDFVISDPALVIIKVAVADYVASGEDDRGRPTACYLRIVPLEEVK